MRFVLVSAPEGSSFAQRAIQWAFICEGSVKVGRRTRQVKPGDHVVGYFGHDKQLLEVTAAGPSLSKLTDYTGAVKVCFPATKAMVDARKAADAAWEKVDEVENEASALEEAAMEALGG